jgi:hypothetical protein
LLFQQPSHRPFASYDVKFQQLQSTGSCGIHSGANILPDVFTQLCLFACLCMVEAQAASSHFGLLHQATRIVLQALTSASLPLALF